MRKKSIKTSEAAALQYMPGIDAAPKLVAAGKGDIADKIIQTAKENDVPVYEDKNLAHALTALNLGDQIPRELYEVVAQILFFVSEIDLKYKEK